MDECIEISLTGGTIRNGYLSVRGYRDFFQPEGRSDPQERQPTEQGQGHLILELEGMGAIETDIEPNKQVFRWRGWRKFFRLHQLHEGDRVSIRKMEPRRFAVAPRHVRLMPPENAHDEAQQAGGTPSTPSKSRGPTKPRCNELDGKTWLQYSISVWDDIQKNAEELRLGHPAMFPVMLVERLLDCFTSRRDRVVLDPFMGSGSTLVAARNRGKHAIGLEISSQFIDLAKRRLSQATLGDGERGSFEIHERDARELLDIVAPESVDCCITSPPYWDILSQRRTADAKPTRHYGNLEPDLATIPDYEEFLHALAQIFGLVLTALRPGKYCCVVVMDLRKKNRFYPFHSDLAAALQRVGYIYDDVIIWNRQQEYNNLRPLGYPYTFRINKVHEYILIFQKPKNSS